MILRHAAEFTCCGSLDAAKGREVFEERRQEVLSVLLEDIGFPQWWIDEADGLFALSQHKYMQVTENKKGLLPFLFVVSLKIPRMDLQHIRLPITAVPVASEKLTALRRTEFVPCVCTCCGRRSH